MQGIVESVFVVVVSLITTLLVVGLTGIIILLAIDQEAAPLVTEQEPAGDAAGRTLSRARGANARPTHSTVLRTSP